jgi:hypothetical protein
MGISTYTEAVTTSDLGSSKNSLLVMYSTQDPVTGALQYSGPPINAHGSDTYIAWTLIGTHTVWLYTGDLDFVQNVWANYTKAIAFLQSQVDDTGLMNVPLEFANDWGRDGGSGHNSAANVMLYEVRRNVLKYKSEAKKVIILGSLYWRRISNCSWRH